MTFRAHINTNTAPETLYYSSWRCPVCPRAVDVSPPLFKIDCRDGHDWCAMVPVGEPTMAEWREPMPESPPGPNVDVDGKAFERAGDLEPKCRCVLDDCGGVCCLLPGHGGEHECCGDSPGWPGSCQA
jgi:hypothetical protein